MDCWNWSIGQCFWIAVRISLFSNPYFSNSSMAVQCCEYEPLKNSTDRGIAVVNPGQIVIGGEILNGERQYAFDYISDVVKNIKSDGTVSYDVAVRRLTCIPRPNEFTVNSKKGNFKISNIFLI